MELLTYLQDNLKDNKLIRWPEHCFPLRFYIAPFRWYAQRGNDDYRYQAMVRRALGEWEKVSGGKVKFACVDGPDFDGFEVDFDEAMHRGTMYRDFEAHAREAECNLLKKEVE